MARVLCALAGLVSLALPFLGGCVYEQDGPPEAHFEQFSTQAPKADMVTVCHAYGCKLQTPYTFSPSDIAEISALMARIRRDDSPAEERRAIAYAIAWMERRVAPTVGMAGDRLSMDFGSSGDPGQQDCVDEATNTTSYLLVLAHHGLIQHHLVERPFAKDDLSHWTHRAALIKEADQGEGQRRAVRPQLLERRQWRKPNGAGRAELLCTGRLGGQYSPRDRRGHRRPPRQWRRRRAASRRLERYVQAHRGLGLCREPHGKRPVISAKSRARAR